MNEELDMRERLARIDAALAQHDRNRMQIGQLEAERRQEIRFAPWQLILIAAAALMAAGAGIFAAGGAFLKSMGAS
jgi:hypothetical protein